MTTPIKVVSGEDLAELVADTARRCVEIAIEVMNEPNSPNEVGWRESAERIGDIIRNEFVLNTPQSVTTEPANSIDWAQRRGYVNLAEKFFREHLPPTPESDSTTTPTHENPKSDKLTSCQTDSD